MIVSSVTCALPRLGSAASDYKFVDEDGVEVTVPSFEDTYTSDDPGPWNENEAAWHIPTLDSHIRFEGLEQIRIVSLSFSHPVQDNQAGEITQVFLLDKDDLLVGYKRFKDQTADYTFKLRLNSVINYLKIYVVCSKHGAWVTEAHL